MKISDKVEALHADLRDINFDSINIIVLYLLPEAVEAIKDRLVASVSQGARLVCNTWGPKGWQPVKKVDCGFCNNVSLYLYDTTSIPVLTSS